MKIAEIYQSLQGEGLLTGTPSIFIRASGCNLRCWFCDTPYTSWQPEGEDLSVDEIMRRAMDTRLPVAELRSAAAGLPAEMPQQNVRSDLQGSVGFSPRGPVNHVWAEAHATSDLRAPTTDHRLSRHAVLTGGEPMLFAELIPLSQRLREAGYHITIETAGTLNLPVECDLMSISPKLSSSTPSADRDPRWHRRHEQSRHAPEVIRRLLTEYEYQLKFVIDSRADCDEVEAYLEELPEADRSRVLLMPQGTDAKSLAERSAWLEPLCRERGFHFCPRRHIEWYGHARGT
jgi:7-carboxy-7-deazaguanine synthase